MMHAKAKSSITGTEFDSKIQEIERVLKMDAVRKGKPDLYDKYCESARSHRGVEVFFSYSHNDRVLASKLNAFLEESEIDVFLAHEDIEISKEWRKEIFKHLESCDVLLALVTSNFEGSTWANQEVGYATKRTVPVVPLIIGKTDIKRFGFLEALLGNLWGEGREFSKTQHQISKIQKHYALALRFSSFTQYGKAYDTYETLRFAYASRNLHFDKNLNNVYVGFPCR